MSGPSGYGRGGRGAALRELFNAPARKPGQVEEPSQPQQPPPQAAQQEYVGRGLSAVGRASVVSTIGRASPSGAIPKTGMSPVGRGLASLLHQMKTEDQQQKSNVAAAHTPPRISPEMVTPVPSPSHVSSYSSSLSPSPRGRGVAGLYQTSVSSVSSTGSVSPKMPESPVQRVGRGALGLGRGLLSPTLTSQPVSQRVPAVAKSPTMGLGGDDGITLPKTPPQSFLDKPSPVGPAGDAGISATEKMQKLGIQEKRERISKTGSVGQKVPIACNYIHFKCRNEGVYQYAVSFSPQVDSKSMRFSLVNAHRDTIGFVKAFDGAILYLPIKLEEATTIFKSERPTDGVEIIIKIVLTKILPPQQCIQPYNVILRKIMRILDMKQVARHYFDPHKAVSVPQHKLEIWPGYVTAIHEFEGGLMMLADVSHKVLRNQNVLDYMYELFHKYPKTFQEECTRRLVGNIVLTRYNNRTYRIDDIAWDKNPNSTFKYGRDDQDMSFVDYYMKSYNKKISDLEQPLLINRPKKRSAEGSTAELPAQQEIICLVPELASLTGLTDEMRQDFRVMKDIASHTRVTPAQRRLAMMNYIERVNNTPEAKQELAKWGLELDTDIMKTEGRALPPEKIIFQRKTITANAEADWGRDLTRDLVISPVHLQSWMVVFTKRDSNKAMDFIQMMKQVAPQMGIQVNNPLQLEIRDDRTETYLRTIRESLNQQIQMVVIIFPTSRDDRYSAIKKLCCVESPVPSQVIIGRTISQQQKLRSVTQKVALQINCKLGGELWALEIPLKKIMVVGIDVYHDAVRSNKSVGAMVASTNDKLTRWYSRVCFQLPQQELIDGLKLCLTAALRKYHEVNHTLPERIIVFRDGVGDGQLRVVGGYEVEQLKECFTHFGDAYDPKLAVVVVQKRINTRIFADYRGQLENPNPGLVLDHSVTRLDWYDYFLVSQHVRQGTVSPTHYVVVYDGSALKPDHMQRLSYKLTHMYYNWPGTVRVPAPCQYAHKLAYLVGQNIHKEPAHDLSDRLFFL